MLNAYAIIFAALLVPAGRLAAFGTATAAGLVFGTSLLLIASRRRAAAVSASPGAAAPALARDAESREAR